MKRKISVLPFFLIGIFYFLLNYYVLGGLSVIFTAESFKLIFIGLSVFLTICFFLALLRLTKYGMDIFFKVSIHAFVAVTVSELIFASVLIIEDFFRLIFAIFGHHNSVGDFLPDRLFIVSIIALSFSILIILLFVHGMIWGKYAYRVIRQTLYFDDFPKAFDGFTITQISDVHSGSLGSKKAIQKGIDLINAQQSDLFVFTGDLVNNKASEIEPWIPFFAQTKATFGKFSILGNHDYGDYVQWPNDLVKQGNLLTLKKHHASIGFRLLLDEHIEIEKDGEKIILAGVENWGKGFGERGDLHKALTKTQFGDFKVLLSHDPSHWDEQVKNYPSKIHLTLSGHTHGMQFGIEAFGLKWSPVKYRYPHWAGLKEEFGRYLYINRGFGFIGFSGRVGIWPEITVIELRVGK